MYLLLTDETNIQQTERIKFFTYGGLFIDCSNLAKLHEAIESIRRKYGYAANDKLKFDTNSRPRHLSPADVAAAKHEVIVSCVDCECKFIAYVVLHEIARNNSVEVNIQWGASHVIGKFNYFLERAGDYGIVAIDRLPNGVEFEYLARKFTDGLEFKEDGHVGLNKVLLFSSTCINASHISSAMDIVLGSWRYCINEPFNVDAARNMMADLTKLIWCERDGKYLYAFEKGLIFRPKNVNHPPYKAEYDSLLSHINGLLKEL